MKTKTPTVFHLRCTSCGWTIKTKRRILICRQHVQTNPALGALSTKTWCLGKMERLKPAKRAKPTGLAAIDHDISAAQSRLNEAITRVKRATTSVDRWQKRLAYLNRKRASMTTTRSTDDVDRRITLED